MNGWTALDTQTLDIYSLRNLVRDLHAVETGSVGSQTFYGINGGRKLVASNHAGATYTVTTYQI